jgi:hypothetical protein
LGIETPQIKIHHLIQICNPRAREQLCLSQGLELQVEFQLSRLTWRSGKRLDMFLHIMFFHMGVSENSVPLNPMVNDHYPY